MSMRRTSFALAAMLAVILYGSLFAKKRPAIFEVIFARIVAGSDHRPSCFCRLHTAEARCAQKDHHC